MTDPRLTLESRRKRLGWTPTRFAREAGLSPAAYRHWINYDRDIRLSSFLKLCHAAGLRVHVRPIEKGGNTDPDNY